MQISFVHFQNIFLDLFKPIRQTPDPNEKSRKVFFSEYIGGQFFQ